MASNGVERTEGGVVLLHYQDLVDKKDLSKAISAGFGYDGIGLIVVKGVPTFTERRQRLLSLAPQFATLPTDVQAKYEHLPSSYNVGWSFGKELLKEGEFDTYKGSYYANPVHDTPARSEDELKQWGEACLAANIWPREDLPDLEPAFKELGQLIIDVGLLVAYQCDKFMEQSGKPFQKDLLQKTIKNSRVSKARLLSYFPIPDQKERSRDSWCAWHNDHGSLTGLCPPMYTSVNPPFAEIDCPDKAAGLYARTRKGEEVKVAIPRDCIAYQIGETSQIMSGGLLRATPHGVQAIKYPESNTVRRNTFAVFMEPNFDEDMTIPEGSQVKDADVSRFNEIMTFGKFHNITISGYYAVNKDAPATKAP